MRKPTPVMTPSMMSVRWSTERAKSAWKPVMLIQLLSKRVATVWMDSGAPGAFMLNQSRTQRAAGIAVNVRATAETSARDRRRPRVPLMRNPAKGSSGINQRDESGIELRSLEFQQVDLVHVERLARTEDGDDDGEAYGGFGGSDDHHKKDEDLSGDLVPHMREGDEGEVDRVEHQFDRHEDGDDIALDEKTGDADGKEHGGEDQIPGNGNDGSHGALLLLSRE